MKKKSAYDKLLDLSKEIQLYDMMRGLLDWDQETMMPPAAAYIRADAFATCATHIHKLTTGVKFTHLLSQLIDLESGQVLSSDMDAAQKAVLRELRRDHLRAIKLPPAFVKNFAHASSAGYHAWVAARKEKKFSLFSKELDKIVSLCRKKADLLGYKDHPYDALLDLYEPELTVAQLTPLLTRLEAALTPLVKEWTVKTACNTDRIKGHFPAEKQLLIGKDILQKMGLDPNAFRLDTAVHPFCSGLHPLDTRLTTRTAPQDIMSNIGSVMHEGGHGLYNAGRPEKEFGSPLCESVSLGIDESQSRWWERFIGYSLPFWEYYYPLLQKFFPQPFETLPLQDYYRTINRVEPTLIRVESDEMTYNLHIILRYNIERKLIEGSLKVKDLPEMWNSEMERLLGIRPPSDDLGCLQDIHWSSGGFGYFPTYTLGNLYAAQFIEAFSRQRPNWEEEVKKGDLSHIREWQKENIHRWGRMYTPSELIQRATGSPLSEKPFIAYLNKKYGSFS
ncbi:MAG: carboxypeptidase M32 [Verrucomicrobia bacterium]|nr:carboxypeptidase M32 [Verrucomicrobiota bacterium]